MRNNFVFIIVYLQVVAVLTVLVLEKRNEIEIPRKIESNEVPTNMKIDVGENARAFFGEPTYHSVDSVIECN